MKMFEKLKEDRCYVIAEIGGNFRTFDEAKGLVEAAASSGVDAVKLQTYRAETIVSKKAVFDMESTGKISQFEYFKKFEISEELHREIIELIQSKGLDWFSTPSHETDVDMLVRLGCPAMKVGADDANNLPFLKYIALTGLPVFLSTGLCTLEEVKEAVGVIEGEGNDRIVVFHTVSGYPTYPEEVNLNVLNTFRTEFPEHFIGFSDHTLSSTASIAAATMGADVIERHFTLDNNADGPDHRISATPDDMKFIVDTIREVEKMRGSSVKMPFGSEVENRINNRKSVVALKDIEKGEEFTSENIGIRRPGTGIEPRHFEEILGKKAASAIPRDEPLKWEEIG